MKRKMQHVKVWALVLAMTGVTIPIAAEPADALSGAVQQTPPPVPAPVPQPPGNPQQPAPGVPQPPGNPQQPAPPPTPPATPQPVAPATPQPVTLQPLTPQPVGQQGAPGQSTVVIDKYVVGQAQPPVEPGTSVRSLTLEQAIAIALENNLDLKVQRMNPQIQDYNLLSAQAVYRPTLTGSFNQNHTSAVSTSLLDAVTTNRITQSQTYQTALSQNLRWHGSSFSANFNSGRNSDNSLNATRNPAYSASTRLQFSQPLLTNFKIDNNRTTLKTQQISRQIVDIQLQQSIENTRANVRTAYWSLRQAIESIEIQKRSLDLSRRQYEDNKTKVEIGTMAPIDIVQNESLIASGEQAVLNATINWKTAELTLKRLLVSGSEDALYTQTLNPADVPANLDAIPVDIPGAIKTALAQRTDLAVSRKNIESSLFTLALRKNATLPSLGLTGSYQLSGTGGDQYRTISGVRTLIAPGGYGQSLGDLGGFNQPVWTVGANFTYPLGMVASRAAYAQSQITLEQSKATLKALELTVSTDVNNAGLAVQNAFLQLQASRKSREASDKTAEATQTRFDVGMANNFEVATALNNLTNARLNELTSIIRYVNAIAEFERKQKVGG
jgi:outer membrane protein